MRDAQDLEASSEFLQSQADDVGHAAADAGVHFVEDERLWDMGSGVIFRGR
jgi:hypothetical protein